MAKNSDTFVKELVADHRPRSVLPPPHIRALTWFAAGLVLTLGLLTQVQAFRPGVYGQIVHHPSLLIEILSALAIPAVAATRLLRRVVPGLPDSRRLTVALWCLAAVLVASIALGATPLGPESSHVGARHACWLEVLVYGALLLSILLAAAARGYLRFSAGLGALYGLASGLVPAALMQAACMYDVRHGLLFHYAPAVLLSGVGLVLTRVVSSWPSQARG